MLLSADEIEELKFDLETLARELQLVVDRTAEAARPVELDQPTLGRVSRIDAIQQQKMLEANRDAQLGRGQLVRAALRRVDADEYGECLGCGEGIGYARLKVRPESVYCIQCQTARERASSGDRNA